MVSFACEACADVLAKKKLDSHGCRQGFTCLDCNRTFYRNEYRSHTTCVTEAERYQKSVYQPDKKRKQEDVHKELHADRKDGALHARKVSAKQSKDDTPGKNGQEPLKDAPPKPAVTGSNGSDLENLFDMLSSVASSRPKKIKKLLRRLGLSAEQIIDIRMYKKNEEIVLCK